MNTLIDLLVTQDQRSTHTNYLSKLLKSFLSFSLEKDRLLYRAEIPCQQKNSSFNTGGGNNQPVWRRVFYNLFAGCQPQFPLRNFHLSFPSKTTCHGAERAAHYTFKITLVNTWFGFVSAGSMNLFPSTHWYQERQCQRKARIIGLAR